VGKEEVQCLHYFPPEIMENMKRMRRCGIDGEEGA
jgi:hypothetical protein